MRTENAGRLKKFSANLDCFLQQFQMSFRSLRWRLTLSYSLVTIAALLVVELVVIVMMMSYFATNIDLTPETLISSLRAEWTPMVQQFFSEEPPNTEGLREYLDDVQGSAIGTRPLFILGNLQLQMKAQDFLNFYYLLEDRTLVDVVPKDIVPEDELGIKIPYDFLPGLEKPLKAALAGIEDKNQLYEKVNPGNRITGTIPIFRYEPTDVDQENYRESVAVMDVERNLVGVIVFTTKRFPWEFLPISEVMAYIGRSLLIFTFFAGILGSLFGMVTASGLTKRLTKVSEAAHDWSSGDFSVTIRDKTDDELGQLTQDLNIMAEQLENLLDRRQELSVLEERNRLARDLHDSVKQQAFAASAQLGAARVHFKNNPDAAYNHLMEGEILIGKVRQELTDLIQELRPVEMKGKGLVPAVEHYVKDWRRRNDVDVSIQVSGERNLPLNVEKSIFRIIQEALANVSWHSQAENVNIVFNYRSDFLMLTIHDNGQGFNLEETRAKGVGLKSMSERAGLIEGAFHIDSSPGKGTKISLKYPYQKMEM